jgi:hypothetical protein
MQRVKACLCFLSSDISGIFCRHLTELMIGIFFFTHVPDNPTEEYLPHRIFFEHSGKEVFCCGWGEGEEVAKGERRSLLGRFSASLKERWVARVFYKCRLTISHPAIGFTGLKIMRLKGDEIGRTELLSRALVILTLKKTGMAEDIS